MVQTGCFCLGMSRRPGRLMTHFGYIAVALLMAIGAESAFASEIAQRVTAHLTAGEFGSAMTLALAATTADERTTLVKQVADAQSAAGETDAALGTMRRIPRSNDRANDRAKSRPAQPSLAGGGMMAVMQLRTLIMQNTSSTWEEGDDGLAPRITPFTINGVKVSPNGLLHRLTTEENAGQLTAMGLQARQADLNQEIARKSQMRMVSLTRLEKAIAQRINEGLPVPESMALLGGLSQVKYVFVYPESHEIVLAGPANAWQYDGQGQAISLNDGRPTLQLDDLVTVLRTFARGDADFGCSINTRDEGVKALKEYVEASMANGPVSDKATKSWITQLQRKLGRQDVVVWGVPSDSRVARVIVQADYRMKLIGIDKLDAGKEIPSYFDLLQGQSQKNAPNLDALRWWLTMQFDGVLHSADKSAFEIRGSSVLCQSENQLLTSEGKHVPTGQAEAINRMFAQNFTTHYAKLAAKDLVFADMQNIFDLALCSALIKNEHLDQRANWDMGVFAPNGAYFPASYPVPKEIESVVNHRVYRGRDIVVQVAGGVNANVMSVAKDPKLNKAAPQLEKAVTAAKAPELPVGRWWWDAAN